ncbi:MAG: insulinase family protein [Bacilli bacterium]|nr:insulinase family protein [Bacilli bacterium]
MKYAMDGYDLYLIKTNRFKTVEYKVNIRIKSERDNDIYLPLLKRILISSSSKYDTIKQINEACALIYDPYYSINIVKSGHEDIISLTATFACEKYTEKGMNDENIKFVSHFLFEPKVNDGLFDEEIFEIKKSKLIEYYNSIKDHPRDYADERLDEEMDYLGYKNYTLDELIEKLKTLTNRQLYNFYTKIMTEGKLDVFICGNDIDDMKDIVFKYVKYKESRKGIINHIISQKDYNIKPNIVIEESNNIQSNLIIGCKVIDMSEFERKYVFPVYSWILGGGMNSLLNQTVREENSLCYYIYASRRGVSGIMKIYAGIDGKNFDKTYDLIQKQMDKVTQGDFSLELFEGVKKIYKSSLISIEDYQDDMVNSFISEIYTSNDSIKIRKKMIDRVTVDAVKEFSKKVHIDTTFLLKGDS